MKRNYLIILILLFGFPRFTFSQPYMSLFREDATWQHSEYQGLYSMNSWHISVDPDFDTLIDGKHLKRFLANDYYYYDYYYYEDTLLGKVFWVNSDFSNELLLYDFSLGIGDSITNFFRDLGPPDSLEPPLYVKQIDTLIIGGKARKILWLERDNFYNFCDQEVWIEGIGSDIGLMRENPISDCWHIKYYLTCYKLSSVPVDLLGLLQEIYCSAMGLQVADQPKEINLYPNPASTILHLDYQGNINSINLYNITGDLVSYHIGLPSVIDVAHLLPGIYFLKISTEEGEMRSRFIKL